MKKLSNLEEYFLSKVKLIYERVFGERCYKFGENWTLGCFLFSDLFFSPKKSFSNQSKKRNVITFVKQNWAKNNDIVDISYFFLSLFVLKSKDISSKSNFFCKTNSLNFVNLILIVLFDYLYNVLYELFCMIIYTLINKKFQSLIFEISIQCEGSTT